MGELFIYTGRRAGGKLWGSMQHDHAVLRHVAAAKFALVIVIRGGHRSQRPAASLQQERGVEYRGAAALIANNSFIAYIAGTG